jgi:hypothetical protein
MVGILSQTLRFCKENAKFLAILAAINVGLGVIGYPFYSSLPNPGLLPEHDAAANAAPAQFSHPYLSALIVLVVVLMSILAQLLCYAPAVWGITQRYLGFEASVGDCFRAAWRRKDRIVLVYVAASVGIMFGTICCFAPGVYLGLMWYLAIPVLMFEDVRAMDALKRSRHLMQGHMLKALVIGFGATLLTLPLTLGLDYLSIPYVSALVSEVVGAAVFVFDVVAVSVIYFSARCTIEPITMEGLSQICEAQGGEIAAMEDA